ncbi:hypothetical protein E4U53_004971, partial [Claviceps sorghi]
MVLHCLFLERTPLMATFGTDLFLTSVNQSAPSVGPSGDAAAQTGFAQDPVTMASWDENDQKATLAPTTVSIDNSAPSPHWSNNVQSTSSVSSPSSSAPGKPEASSASSSSSSRSSPSASSTSSLPTKRVRKGSGETHRAEFSGKFVIMTPDSMHAQTGRPNPFECLEAMRGTRRGRKGPLPGVTAQDALEVRRFGACYCCRSRKVKCDKRRPCRHCERLMLHVPQVVCWRFQDFLPVLFPDFIRAHFKKESMAAFLRENMDGWPSARGTKQQQQQQQQQNGTFGVELFSGPRFSAVLSVEASFFAAKTCDVLQHWHLNPAMGRAHIQSSGSAPIGVEINTPAQRDDLRKRLKAYVQDLLREPCFAEQVTDSLTSTRLPLTILRIVQTYARQSD